MERSESPTVETGTAEKEYRYLTPAIREAIDQLIPCYPERRPVVTQALWLIQDHWGFIPLDAQAELAAYLDLPLVWIREVVTFYNMYHERPIGAHLIYFCCNISCSLRGARQLYRYLLEKLGIADRETTPDGNITVEKVQCIGACELAPVMQIDGEFVGPVDTTVIDEWIERLRQSYKKAQQGNPDPSNPEEDERNLVKEKDEDA